MVMTSANTVSIARLRQLLHGVRWKVFVYQHTIAREHVRFYCVPGLHLGKPVIAVVGRHKFVAIKPMAQVVSFAVGGPFFAHAIKPELAHNGKIQLDRLGLGTDARRILADQLIITE